MINKLNKLTDEAAMKWARKRYWTLYETFWLLKGLAPEGAAYPLDHVPSFDEYGTGADELVYAIDARIFAIWGYDKYRTAVFKPSDILRIAKIMDIGVWQFWENVFAAKSMIRSTNKAKRDGFL